MSRKRGLREICIGAKSTGEKYDEINTVREKLQDLVRAACGTATLSKDIKDDKKLCEALVKILRLGKEAEQDTTKEIAKLHKKMKRKNISDAVREAYAQDIKLKNEELRVEKSKILSALLGRFDLPSSVEQPINPLLDTRDAKRQRTEYLQGRRLIQQINPMNRFLPAEDKARTFSVTFDGEKQWEELETLVQHAKRLGLASLCSYTGIKLLCDITGFQYSHFYPLALSVFSYVGLTLKNNLTLNNGKARRKVLVERKQAVPEEPAEETADVVATEDIAMLTVSSEAQERVGQQEEAERQAQEAKEMEQHIENSSTLDPQYLQPELTLISIGEKCSIIMIYSFVCFVHLLKLI